MHFIDLKTQYLRLKHKIDSRIQTVLNHGQYIMGPEVFELEEKLAEYVKVKHCISCGNGTDALQLALMTLDVKEGDAIFCPTFTFFATAEVIPGVNATPIFVDIDKTTFNISPSDLEKRIKACLKEGKLTPKAIIAVDLFGLPADYPKLEVIAAKYNLKLVEDAAQGFGGEIRGKKACSFGDIATTSFFPAKPLGCYGDGGAIFTNNDDYAEQLRSLRLHGKGQDKYDNIRIGINSRLDTIQAAILLEKLHEFPTELILRHDIAKAYSSALEGIIYTPQLMSGFSSSWAQYTLSADKRDSIISALSEKGIPTAIYYKTCLHQQTAFKSSKVDRLPVAEKLSTQVFSLPIHPYLDKNEQLSIQRHIKTLYRASQ